MPRAALASACVLLVALLAALSLSVAAPADAAAKPCWQKILEDWSDNGRIDKTYPDSCYVAALRNLPRDVKHYSDAVDEIESARLEALRERNRVPSSVGPDSVGGGPSGGPGNGGNGPSSGGGDDDGPLGRVLNFAPNAVGDAPVPLLALAGVALLLMAAGGAGLLSRHLQTKRADAAPGPGGDPGEPLA